MNLTVLGSRAIFPNSKGASNCYLLKFANNLVMIDAGPGSLRQFDKIKDDYFDLTHILISHTHSDHIADLMSLLVAIFVRSVPNFQDKKRTKPLIIIGPPGFKKAYSELRKIMFPEKDNYEIQVLEMGNSVHQFKNWKLETTITRHVDFLKSVSHKLVLKDKIFVYSGDTAFCPEIINFCHGASTLLLECTLPKKEEFPKTHLNPQLAGELAVLSEAKTLILGHNELNNPSEMKEEIAKKFKDKIIIAKDLMKIKL